MKDATVIASNVTSPQLIVQHVARVCTSMTVNASYNVLITIMQAIRTPPANSASSPARTAITDIYVNHVLLESCIIRYVWMIVLLAVCIM